MADARDFDFQIGDLCFRGATSDRFPYVRATAPFRKEQVDNSSQVGDQSLTGWWTRGQLSFHKGKGLDYYDLLEGSEVLGRYDSSISLNATVPGEVTLFPEGGTLGNGTITFTDVTAVTHVLGDTEVAYIDSGNVYRSTTSGTVTTLYSGGDAAYLACASDGALYFSTPVGILRRNGATDETVYTYPTGDTSLGGLWAAKDRLWAIGSTTGDVYAVAFEPGTPGSALADPVATLDPEPNGLYRLADTASRVYLASNFSGKVHSIGVEVDGGGVATYTSVTEAATLPPGERIADIQPALGYVLLMTSEGIRVADIALDGGLTYGPPHDYAGISATEDNTGVAIRGNIVYCNPIDPVAIDLNGPIDQDSPLEFPTHRVGLFVNGVAANGFTEGGLFAEMIRWDSENITTQWASTSNELRSTGTLTTAYHRLGTLDAKSFQTVLVRCGGDGGQIEVSQVDDDGTRVSLGTITPAEKSKTFSFTLSAPAERVALRFVLTPDAVDATDGPTLLGYQIKALPVPERQRILRWPLLLHDVVRLRRGAEVGTRGKALTDLQALEALESSQAVVDFTDHRTNETGTAYVDSVEFQSDTPSNRNGSNFGGISYITLRVLS